MQFKTNKLGTGRGFDLSKYMVFLIVLKKMIHLLHKVMDLPNMIMNGNMMIKHI